MNKKRKIISILLFLMISICSCNVRSSKTAGAMLKPNIGLTKTKRSEVSTSKSKSVENLTKSNKKNEIHKKEEKRGSYKLKRIGVMRIR